jgi:cytochrome b involved in lipid metabolism
MYGAFTTTEVALHNKASDLWIILNGEVYDVTAFQSQHPGGQKSRSNIKTVLSILIGYS